MSAELKTKIRNREWEEVIVKRRAGDLGLG
jgi:hypothetical protein